MTDLLQCLEINAIGIGFISRFIMAMATRIDFIAGKKERTADTEWHEYTDRHTETHKQTHKYSH